MIFAPTDIADPLLVEDRRTAAAPVAKTQTVTTTTTAGNAQPLTQTAPDPAAQNQNWIAIATVGLTAVSIIVSIYRVIIDERARSQQK